MEITLSRSLISYFSRSPFQEIIFISNFRRLTAETRTTTPEFLVEIMLFKLFFPPTPTDKNQDDEHVSMRTGVAATKHKRQKENLLIIKLKRGLRKKSNKQIFYNFAVILGIHTHRRKVYDFKCFKTTTTIESDLCQM